MRLCKNIDSMGFECRKSYSFRILLYVYINKFRSHSYFCKALCCRLMLTYCNFIKQLHFCVFLTACWVVTSFQRVIWIVLFIFLHILVIHTRWNHEPLTVHLLPPLQGSEAGGCLQPPPQMGTNRCSLHQHSPGPLAAAV